MVDQINTNVPFMCKKPTRRHHAMALFRFILPALNNQYQRVTDARTVYQHHCSYGWTTRKRIKRWTNTTTPRQRQTFTSLLCRYQMRHGILHSSWFHTNSTYTIHAHNQPESNGKKKKKMYEYQNQDAIY